MHSLLLNTPNPTYYSLVAKSEASKPEYAHDVHFQSSPLGMTMLCLF